MKFLNRALLALDALLTDWRSRLGLESTPHLGWMSEQWLLEQRASRRS